MKPYNYKPSDDLTIHELSDIMRVLFVSLIEGIQRTDIKGEDDLQIDDIILDSIPEHARRHFIRIEDIEDEIGDND